MKIKITYEVEDGYCGKSRPQHVTFDSGDYVMDDEWNDLPEEEKEELIHECIQEHFNQHISWCIMSKIKEGD